MQFTENAMQSLEELLNNFFTVVSEPQVKAKDYTVDCGDEYMTVVFSQKFLTKTSLTGRQLQIKSVANCDNAVYSSSSRLSVRLGSSCFVKKEQDEENFYYTFEVEMPPENLNGVITNWGNHWMATCEYGRRKSVTTLNQNGDLVPALEWVPHTGESGQEDFLKLSGSEYGQGEFSVQLESYHSSAYAQKFGADEYPLQFNMGERLNLEINFSNENQSSHLFLVAEQCWAQPAVGSNTKYGLIDNRCADADLVSIEDRPAYNVDRWSTQVFKFPGDTLFVHITCDVLICFDADDCDRQCNKRRKRRAAARTQRVQVVHKQVSLGEIRVLGEQQKSQAFDAGNSTPIGVNILLAGIMVAFVIVSVYTTRLDRLSARNGPVEQHASANAAFEEAEPTCERQYSTSSCSTNGEISTL